MDDVPKQFGERLRRVREQVKGLERPAVALNVLGDGASQKARTQFANYLARVERDNTNISLAQLSQYATGLAFPSMSAFWQALEQADSSAKNTLPTAQVSAHDSPLRLQKVNYETAHHSPALASSDPVSLADFERVIYGAVATITDALARIGEQLEARGSAAAATRTPAPRRRRNPRARPRKSA